MADLRTTITELATGLGALGYASVEEAILARPPEMVSMSPELWAQLKSAFDGGGMRGLFESAFDNGSVFFNATDGLRRRRPVVVEWKGAHKNPGDEALPADLRIDHVYLISCKYDSKILHNRSPRFVFDSALRRDAAQPARDWFSEVAADSYQSLYAATRAHIGADFLPELVGDLTKDHGKLIQQALGRGSWPDDLKPVYLGFCADVSAESARRWQASVPSKKSREEMLWRLLRLGPAPYFILGTSGTQATRARIATPWDWRQQYQFKDMSFEAVVAGQPLVAWRAEVKDMHSGTDMEVSGLVEIRWSHGRFSGHPEAKVHLVTPIETTPGYLALK